MLQSNSVPVDPPAERLQTAWGRRTVGIGLALLIEGLLLLALLSLGPAKQPGREKERITTVNLDADKASEEAKPSSTQSEQRVEEKPAPQQPTPEEVLPSVPSETPPSPPAPPLAKPPVAPIARAVVPVLNERPAPVANPPRSTEPLPPRRPVYGPPDSGGSPAFRDTERVGTAPNGEPLYAAAWYSEPKPEQLRGYLSTANGPGWGLIACRTVPDYRVEDCVALDEYPNGSQINRAVLAAAWEFKVRPPRLGGQSLVGAWVRIRIDYGWERR